MKVTITHDGFLNIVAEYGLESYAIQKWHKENFPAPLSGSNTAKIIIHLCDKEDPRLANQKMVNTP